MILTRNSFEPFGRNNFLPLQRQYWAYSGMEEDSLNGGMLSNSQMSPHLGELSLSTSLLSIHKQQPATAHRRWPSARRQEQQMICSQETQKDCNSNSSNNLYWNTNNTRRINRSILYIILFLKFYLNLKPEIKKTKQNCTTSINKSGQSFMTSTSAFKRRNLVLKTSKAITLRLIIIIM